jgi:hypothetical protein
MSLRTILILLLCAALAACRAPEPAAEAREAPLLPPPPPEAQGKWRPLREAPADVRALPYLQGYRAAQDRPLVIQRDRSAVSPGLNLYVSGHAAEAELMDMDGRTLHRWRYPLRRLWPDLAADPSNARLEYWRRAYLFPNGDLLGIYEGLGIVKLDARSRVLWSRRGGFHHDLFVQDDGSLWVLDREGKILSRINPGEGVLEDFATELGPSGQPLRRISILQAFERSRWAGLLQRMPRQGDLLHTNTLEVLDGRFADRDPAFRKGNLLVSVHRIDTLAVIDPDQGTVVWARTGSWRRQHQPTFLEDGRLLMFDNLGAGRSQSRVVELDPRTGRILWQFGKDLFSKTLGSCQRLPNGNTLITESENGRALEVTRGGQVVWEFHNPHRAGDHRELVAVLFEMVRLPPDFPFRGLPGAP